MTGVILLVLWFCKTLAEIAWTASIKDVPGRIGAGSVLIVAYLGLLLIVFAIISLWERSAWFVAVVCFRVRVLNSLVGFVVPWEHESVIISAEDLCVHYLALEEGKY